jgi:hypothetical protein
MAGDALLARHRHCAGDGGRHRFGIVGIDEQRARAEFRRGAGKPRENEHARIVRVLRGDILLRHQIHSVAKRCDQRNTRSAIEA